MIHTYYKKLGNAGNNKEENNRLSKFYHSEVTSTNFGEHHCKHCLCLYMDIFRRQDE